MIFGANTSPNGTYPDADQRPVFSEFLRRSVEYRRLSPTPDNFDKLNLALADLYKEYPKWTAQQLGTIRVPTLVLAAEYDEVIKPQHTCYIAESIPEAKLRFIKEASHFAFLQKPDVFNELLLNFLLTPLNP